MEDKVRWESRSDKKERVQLPNKLEQARADALDAKKWLDLQKCKAWQEISLTWKKDIADFKTLKSDLSLLNYSPAAVVSDGKNDKTGAQFLNEMQLQELVIGVHQTLLDDIQDKINRGVAGAELLRKHSEASKVPVTPVTNK